MSSSVRRKGKPGKGGGKGSSRGGRGGRSHASKSHGGGSGGGGIGGNRKASSRIWDDGDDFCIFSESRRSSRSLHFLNIQIWKQYQLLIYGTRWLREEVKCQVILIKLIVPVVLKLYSPLLCKLS